MTEPFDTDRFRRVLSELTWVREVHPFASISSTNDEALRLAASGAREGTVVVADSQSAGRGRLGRSWSSRPGCGLLASWIVRPSLPVERWPLLGLATGVAAAEAVEATSGLAVELKWPNDLLAGERKLGGILAEARLGDSLVLGLGLNVSGAVPGELERTATSIERAGGSVPDRAVLLAAVLERFVAAAADVDAALARYRERCITIGRTVRVERATEVSLEGVAAGIDSDGALLVERSGALVRVSSGEAVHVRSDGGAG